MGHSPAGAVGFMAGLLKLGGAPAQPVSEPVFEYKLVITYVDEDSDDVTQTFASADEREQAIRRLFSADRPYRLDGDADEDVVPAKAVATVTFEDKAVFWRKTAETPNFPERSPRVFDGVSGGELALVLTGSRQTAILELGNYKPGAKLIDNPAFAQAMDEASVVWRRVVAERRSVLQPVN